MKRVKRIHITPEDCVTLRKNLGMKQEEFWGAIGIGTSTGSGWERDRHRIPETVQVLIHAVHVAGVPMTDPDRLERIGKIAANVEAVTETLDELDAALKESISKVRRARHIASKIDGMEKA